MRLDAGEKGIDKRWLGFMWEWLLTYSCCHIGINCCTMVLM